MLISMFMRLWVSSSLLLCVVKVLRFIGMLSSVDSLFRCGFYVLGFLGFRESGLKVLLWVMV